MKGYITIRAHETEEHCLVTDVKLTEVSPSDRAHIISCFLKALELDPIEVMIAATVGHILEEDM